ncbi:unnamed protein product [Sphenostylis stenocarpa]|uniref:Uncharacterized protein n=1 Tax=Sphenostylis stenocarpa TaxID=92480 RepID=A0AA86V3E4_9FABA|nr:unnamed protein product [Sphenostylis stenocarpa]
MTCNHKPYPRRTIDSRIVVYRSNHMHQVEKLYLSCSQNLQLKPVIARPLSQIKKLSEHVKLRKEMEKELLYT